MTLGARMAFVEVNRRILLKIDLKKSVFVLFKTSKGPDSLLFNSFGWSDPASPIGSGAHLRPAPRRSAGSRRFDELTILGGFCETRLWSSSTAFQDWVNEVPRPPIKGLQPS